jgi:hypothetical protein
MRQHCVQCLAEILGGGRQAPTGETLCGSCFSALWGPQATEELRSLVRLHTGRHARNGDISLAPARG